MLSALIWPWEMICRERGKLSRAPPAPALGWGWGPAGKGGGLRGSTCVHTGMDVYMGGGMGGGCYLNDVNGQLAVTVAVQPLGGHILGPAL